MEPGPRKPVHESVEGWKKSNVKALFFPLLPDIRERVAVFRRLPGFVRLSFC